MFATEAKALIDLHPSSNLSAQCTIDEWEELCIRKHRTKLLTGLRRSSENSFTKQFCWHLAIVQLDAIRVQWFRKKSWGWQVVVIVGKKNLKHRTILGSRKVQRTEQQITANIWISSQFWHQSLIILSVIIIILSPKRAHLPIFLSSKSWDSTARPWTQCFHSFQWLSSSCLCFWKLPFMVETSRGGKFDPISKA